MLANNGVIFKAEPRAYIKDLIPKLCTAVIKTQFVTIDWPNFRKINTVVFQSFSGKMMRDYRKYSVYFEFA